MSHVVVLVVIEPELCSAVLDAWEELGVPGVTIFPSSGLSHYRKMALREDLPLMPSLYDLMNEEMQHRTLVSVVETQEMIDKMAAAAENVLGCVDAPDTGFMFVVPAVKVFGSKDKSKKQ